MKKKVGVIGGGPSVEHEISLQSANNVFQAISSVEFDKVLIGITKEGAWYYVDHVAFTHRCAKGTLFALEEHPELLLSRCSFDLLKDAIDIAFPVLHGHLGEDGAVQGLFKCLGIPFVGPGLLDAALTMDKEVLKRLAEGQGIAVAPYFAFRYNEKLDIDRVSQELGYPVFVKPCNTGSSLGVTKVTSPDELISAVTHAFYYDSKILIEKAITCREIECAILGNEHIEVTDPAEVICHHEFYSYEAKYLDQKAADLSIPAKLSVETKEAIKNLAKQAYLAGCCQGMARVDFFLEPNGTIYLNEVNAIPGFTNISLYPKLWEHEGLSQQQLVKKLIDLGFERKTKEDQLMNNFIKKEVFI